ncbi:MULTISPECIES: preprotein translocase subunit YajC [Kocuria]|uniref:preprotein translocase subunit YajC n=1 Tax=Kocuria TaxID=57493 RepID=UPI000BAB5249|nr:MULTISPECIES: preprotein translocase subunit YajC [Kocuria]NVC24965.1 preprotein translocase subunit YajC [Kocuria salina]MCM3485596.1 preprotein translocase subunit YajC [Kocuria rosea]MEB2528642.1 preprotein translocase subunit YajC [Kocuria rosea]MEB2618884.1 preprotein translocase subunit YajC [Kocuria rosea]PAU90635.1 preprotein translocase subunit YajC [Kocuria sp. WN036]
MSPLLLVQSLPAQAAQPTGGSTAWLLPLMLVAMVLLLWLPMRRQKKAVAQVKEKQAAMGPGTEVMTNYGLYGTVRSIDRDTNKVVLEIAPGTAVTVHLQTVTTVVEDEAAPAAETEAAPSVVEPDAPGAGSTPVEPLDDDARREPGQRND